MFATRRTCLKWEISQTGLVSIRYKQQDKKNADFCDYAASEFDLKLEPVQVLVEKSRRKFKTILVIGRGADLIHILSQPLLKFTSLTNLL